MDRIGESILGKARHWTWQEGRNTDVEVPCSVWRHGSRAGRQGAARWPGSSAAIALRFDRDNQSAGLPHGIRGMRNRRRTMKEATEKRKWHAYEEALESLIVGAD